ncbi:type II secretion system protein GspL [Desulfuromonas sp. AOP6]|uniref:type II secretion system protein GspL n=1 Tax=Desulfuromonas sp. AOP6 TaxID=1566351 RepID=UPI001276D4F0|nr:type II secretion system protein GspL [Desulfuromonas sp. AOP6]BCA80384.1 hypothetical protein AOP6_2171 [Desulfuromonas sp. AOP6]
MAKRQIGIDLDAGTVRVAVLQQEKGEPARISLGHQAYADEAELAAALKELIGTELHYGDRFAAALPASEGFVRRLSFPFADPKKIAAALSFELASQLPLSIEDCVTDFQRPVPGPDGGFSVTAAAVRAEAIPPLLGAFEAAQLPLHTIDLAPFAYAKGLKEQVNEGILACLQGQEATVSLVLDGRLVDYRILPLPAGQSADKTARALHLEGRALQQGTDYEDLPFFLMGSAVTTELKQHLPKLGAQVRIPAFLHDDDAVSPEFLPAVALALRAGLGEKDKGFNFRSGPFALKTQWGINRTHLISAGILCALILLTLTGSAYLNFSSKAQRARALQAEMTKAFRETFPGPQAVVDIPLQMRGKVKELQDKLVLFGLDQTRTPLASLQQISQTIPKDVTVDIREWNYSEEGIRMEGQTTSFDAINRIVKALEQTKNFASVQISDAKMSLEGNLVDFRLSLTPAKQGGDQ